MKKHLLCFLTFCLISFSIYAQDAPRIISVSVAGDGAFVSWIQEGEAGDSASSYAVLQMIDGEMEAIHQTADLNSGFYFVEGTSNDGPLTFQIATLDGDGEQIAVSDAHSTVHVSITSDECADPIVIEWTPYVGFEGLMEHTVFKGEGALSDVVGVFDGDVFTTEYFLEESDEGVLIFSVQSSPDGITKVASNLAPVDSCVEPGAGGGDVGIDDLLVASLTVGPNPVQDLLTVSYDSTFAEELVLSVFTLDGKKVGATSFVGQTTLSANNWANGVYVYNITDNAGNIISTGKLLK